MQRWLLTPQERDSVDRLTVNDLIRFSEYFKRVLTSLYGEEAREIYAYYEKRTHTPFSYPKIATTHPFAFKLYCGISKFESIVFTESTVMLFNVLYTGDHYEVKTLSKNVFVEQKDFLYESQGLIDNGWMMPKSELYISGNAIEPLYINKKDTLINHHLLSNDFLKQIEEIYQAITRKGYQVTPQTTVKSLYRDIIEPLYPNMGEKHQIMFCKIFKGEIS